MLISVAVGPSKADNCLLADHTESQLVYLFCIIITNSKRRPPLPEAQGKPGQISVRVKENYTKSWLIIITIYLISSQFAWSWYKLHFSCSTMFCNWWNDTLEKDQDCAIAEKILCPDCQEWSRRSHTWGKSCSRRLKSCFCAHTQCVPTSPILGPASRCRHFMSRCPSTLYIVFHHMISI